MAPSSGIVLESMRAVASQAQRRSYTKMLKRVFSRSLCRRYGTDAAPYIPVIDLTPFFEGTPEGKALVARQVDDACRNIGFFTVVGHGVDQVVIDNAWTATKRFFDLPVSDKA